MGWLKRVLSLEKRVEDLEWYSNHRNCKDGDHNFEIVISPFAKCKHCKVAGKVTDTVEIDTSDDIL